MNKQDFFDEIQLRIKQIEQCMNVYRNCDFDVELDWKKTSDDLCKMYFSNDKDEDSQKFYKKLMRLEPKEGNHNEHWYTVHRRLLDLYRYRSLKTPEQCQEFLEKLMTLKPQEDSHE